MLASARSKVVWIISLVCAITTQSAWGQYPVQQPMGRYQKINPQGQQQQPYQKQYPLNKQGPVQIMTSGTIEAITSNGLQVDANGTKMLVAGDKSCKVEVTGAADASFLKPGMLVRFSGDVDKKSGKATATVTSIEVISPQTAMSGDEPQGGGNTRLKGKKAAAQAPPSGIVGHLKEVKANEITVDTPGGTVKAELSATATVKVNVTDPHMAQQMAQVGDKIDIHGYSTQPPNVIAQEMRITLADKKSGPKPNEKPAAASN